MKLIVSARADLDVGEALAWYEESEPGAGAPFLAAIERSYYSIAELPEGYPEVEPDTRRRLAKPYPYLVYYRPLEDSVLFLRVVHTSRRPGAWQEEA